MPTHSVNTILDHKLRAYIPSLPDGVARHLTDALSIPNLEKENAKKQHIWGWERMPDEIDLWEIDGDWLVMPRGFANVYADGLRLYDCEIAWEDRRTWNPQLKIGVTQHEPKPWQEKQIEAVLSRHQGIVKSPAGSGKTAMILFALKRLGCKSLVIVNTKDIMWQWQKRVVDFLGPDYPFGQVGDGVMDVSPYITVATAQTLHRRYDELEAEGFFDEFSFVCLDECHHATAETYNKLLNRFSARYRVGVSATPDKTGDFTMAVCVLGPIIQTTKPSEVDTLQMPTVIRVPTKFGFSFRGTKSRWQRSNYPQLIQALITNKERNELIARVMKSEEGHHSLAISKRLEHLDILEALLMDMDYDGHVLKLTGDLTGKKGREARQEIVEIANSEPCMILSTLADEALDIPRLDRGFLVYPQKNAGLVTQQVGRFERKHPDKKDAIIFDFYDGNVGPLDKQWRVRRFEVYEPRSYKIITRKGDTFLPEQMTLSA